MYVRTYVYMYICMYACMYVGLCAYVYNVLLQTLVGSCAFRLDEVK